MLENTLMLWHRRSPVTWATR